MKTYKKCFSCFERQAADACAISGLDARKTETVLNAVREKIKSFPCTHPPVEMAVEIHKLVCSTSGIKDPYSDIKRESNRVCRECIPMLMESLAWSLDPLKTAVQLAIAGNIIDFGAYNAFHLSKQNLFRITQEVLTHPLEGNPIIEFEKHIKNAGQILYIADNAGECFFDSVLLDFIPAEKVTYAVRGGPILNDATMEDAETAGIKQKCPVIDTGDNAPGILLDRCSNEFQEAFKKSDVIIAKGQGNYESLNDQSEKTYVFLTKVKCDVIARDIGCPVGSNVLKIQDSVGTN